MFPRKHTTRDACFLSVIHVSPHIFLRDACFLDCSGTLIANVAIANVATLYRLNKDQVQINHNKVIASYIAISSSFQNIENRRKISQ